MGKLFWTHVLQDDPADIYTCSFSARFASEQRSADSTRILAHTFIFRKLNFI